jgi:hypothetical protein
MTAVSLVYDAVFVSGKCPAVTGVRRRARTLRPAVGRSAPTLLLHREWGA